MFLINRPSPATIEHFIVNQRSKDPTYKDIGITKTGNYPFGYGIDKVKGQLGSGSETFQLAITAFKNWQQFKVGWVEVYPRPAAIETNQVIAVLAQHWFFWSLNACRILYVIDNDGPIKRFGFGYGTLADHAETGEERFLLEWDQQTNIVSYEILAFSNPHHWLARLGFPLTRFIQDKFRRDSLKVMQHQHLTIQDHKRKPVL